MIYSQTGALAIDKAFQSPKLHEGSESHEKNENEESRKKFCTYGLCDRHGHDHDADRDRCLHALHCRHLIMFSGNRQFSISKCSWSWKCFRSIAVLDRSFFSCRMDRGTILWQIVMEFAWGTRTTGHRMAFVDMRRIQPICWSVIVYCN